MLQRIEIADAAAIVIGDFRGGNLSTQAYRANSRVPKFEFGTDDAVRLRDSMGEAPAGNPRT